MLKPFIPNISQALEGKDKVEDLGRRFLSGKDVVLAFIHYCFVQDGNLTMLPSLLLNSWVAVIAPFQPAKSWNYRPIPPYPAVLQLDL